MAENRQKNTKQQNKYEQTNVSQIEQSEKEMQKSVKIIINNTQLCTILFLKAPEIILSPTQQANMQLNLNQ